MAKNAHLKISMMLLFSMGIYPLKFRKPIYNLLYKMYSHFVRIYLITFTIAGFIQIYHLDKSDLGEIAANLGVNLLYSTTIAKMFACRGVGIKNLVRHVRQTETRILELERRDLKEIYFRHVNATHKAQKAVIIFGSATIFSYCIAPLLVRNPEPVYFTETVRNLTVHYEMKALPLSSWFPFNKYKYYYVSYALQICAALTGGFGTVSVDIFIVGFIMFATGQIKIIQYSFKNCKDTARDLRMSNPKSLSALDALKLAVGRCIDMHKVLIKFVTDLDDCIKMLMLVDFVVVTLQMAMLGLQMIIAEHVVQLAYSMEFLVTMFLLLFLFYYNANEIILESLAVCTSIWESDFLDFSPEIRKSLVLVMIRSQVPLNLHVGPFYAMSTTTALLIVRASYSYVALIFQVYGK